MKNLFKFVKENEIAILTGIMIVNLVVVGYFGLFRYSKILKTKYERINQIKKVQIDLDNKLELMNKTKADLNSYDKELTALETNLPKDKDTELLVVQLINKASITGHSLINLRPLNSIIDNNHFLVQADFSGNPGFINEFLENIESIPRLMEIESLTISENKQGATIISLKMNVYIQQTEEKIK